MGDKKELKRIHKNLLKADKRLAQLEEDLAFLSEFKEKYKAINKNLKKLNAYYYDKWMEDVDDYYSHQQTKRYKSLGQDSIWNASEDLYQLKLKMLKVIVDDINTGE